MSIATFVGLLINGIGGFLILVPDLPNGRVRQFFYRRTPRVPYLMSEPISRLVRARDEFFSGAIGGLQYDRNGEEELIEAIYPILCEQFGFEEGQGDEVNEIKPLHNGLEISYRGGRRTQVSGYESRNERINQGIQRAVERRFVTIGAIALVTGFVIQALATIGVVTFIAGLTVQILSQIYDVIVSFL